MGLDTVELVMEIEDAFGVSIPDEDAEKIQTIGQTAAYLVGRLRQTSPGPVPGASDGQSYCQTSRAFYQLRSELARDLEYRAGWSCRGAKSANWSGRSHIASGGAKWR